LAADGGAVLIVDNSDHRRAGSWFADCLRGSSGARIAAREDVKALGAAWKAVILSGSERSVFEDADWILEELDFARRLVDGGIPLLGVCFGHQLLFRALYGKDILRRRALPEVGWPAVKLAPQPAFEGVPKTIYPYNFHFDEVSRVPPGWEAVASSEGCPVHGLCHGELPVLGLQFHPEVTAAEAAAGISRGTPALASYGLDAAAIAAGNERAGYYPEIVRNFIAVYGR
jgi:GMP synthase (glutamine-hydrolysing)